MFINNKYINDDNINTIEYRVKEKFSEYKVYNLDGVLWTLFEDKFYEDYHNNTGKSHNFKGVTPNIMNTAIKNLERVIEYGDEAAKKKFTGLLEKLEEDKILQEKILSKEAEYKYIRKSGNLEIIFNMKGSEEELQENIKRWYYLENLEDNKIVVEDEVSKKYEDNITIIEVMDILKHNTKKMI